MVALVALLALPHGAVTAALESVAAIVEGDVRLRLPCPRVLGAGAASTAGVGAAAVAAVGAGAAGTAGAAWDEAAVAAVGAGDAGTAGAAAVGATTGSVGTAGAADGSPQMRPSLS